MSKSLPLSLALILFTVPGWSAEDAGIEFFEKRIRPVLVKECYECHSAKAQAAGNLKGGLNLDSKAAILRGGDSGPAIVPKKPEESLLLEALNYASFQMPPKGQLKPAVIEDFKKWIRMGAPDPRTGESASLPPAKSEIDFGEGRKHWAFQPPKKSPPPRVKDPDWVKKPIDAFLLKQIEEAGLTPAPQADRRTWIRRVTFDLIGLPPTPEEVQSFLADDSPEAKRRVVERLLGSPHYGEHWARMWLDIARYAEDQAHIVGSDTSLCYPNAWMYRDWVIGAFNDDVPYDRFIRLQLAGDLIEPDSEENLPALGFIGLGPKYYRRGAPEVMADEWEDRVDVVSRGLLALTVACARCHDHKYDPIATEDYYALAGVFASTEMFNRPLDPKAEQKKDGEAKKPEQAMHILKEDDPVDLPVYIRGDVNNKGPIVKRRFLEILDPRKTPFEQGSGRLELAEAITDRNNPLTARVIVNRIWGRYFDRPLVRTQSNFGTLGEEPTHPKLLDDLAVRFMENGWSLKWLHREIVLSAAYAQSSKPAPETQSADPANDLLARMPRKRMSVEQWRDALLSVSGRWDPRIGGESMNPQDPESRRRTVYSEVSRLELNRMLAMFDYPDPNTHAEMRVETTTPLQKLFVINSPFMVAQAEAFANRLTLGRPDFEDRITWAYELCYNRLPGEVERKLAREFFENDRDSKELWLQYAQVLLAANELYFID